MISGECGSQRYQICLLHAGCISLSNFSVLSFYSPSVAKPTVQIQQRQIYSGHSGSIYALAVNSSQTTAYTSGDDGVVAAWQLDQAEDEGVGILQVDKAVYALAWISGHEWLVAGRSDGTMDVIDPVSKVVIHQQRKLAEAVYGLAYEPERDYLWILYGKGFLSVINVATWEEVGFQRLAGDHLRAILFSPFDPRIFVGSSDRQVLVLDKTQGGVIEQWKAHENSVFALALHPDNRYLLSGGRDAHLNVWSSQPPYDSIQKIPAHNFTINDIVFSPDGAYVLTASRDKTLKLWDATSLQLLKVIDMFRDQGHRHSVNRLCWLRDGTVLSASDDRRMIRWKWTVGAAD